MTDLPFISSVRMPIMGSRSPSVATSIGAQGIIVLSVAAKSPLQSSARVFLGARNEFRQAQQIIEAKVRAPFSDNDERIPLDSIGPAGRQPLEPAIFGIEVDLVFPPASAS